MHSTDSLLDAYIADQAGRLAPLTASEYRRYLVRIAADHDDDLLAVTAFSARRFLANPDWSASTRNFALRALRSFFRWAVTAELVDDDPTAKIQMAKVTVPDVRVADDTVRDALLAACRTNRDRAFVAVLFGSGCRRGEVVALELNDVDLVEGTLRIRTSKNGRPRSAVLDSVAAQHLRRYLTERTGAAAATDRLWLNQQGGPLTAAGAKMVLRRLSVRSGVTFSSHDARRGYATRWLRAGGSETGLMAVCGWSSSAMVGRYVRMNAQELGVDEARRLFG